MDVTKMIPIDGELDMSSMVETKEIIWTTFTLKIEKYSELKDNVIYCRYEHALQHQWTFKFVKTDLRLFLILETEHVKEFVKFTILGKDDRVLNDGQASYTLDKQFVTSFMKTLISDPENGYLIDDCLVVECKYIEKQSDGKIHVLPWDEYRERIDLENFLSDWKDMYFENRFCDLKIFIKNHVFCVHKVILAARSAYFANRLADGTVQNEVNLTPDISPLIFHEVLMFIYTGELKEMTINVLLDIFDLADYLDICALVMKCIPLLSKGLTVNNVETIFYKAKDIGSKRLMGDCLQYARENCPEKLNHLKE